MEREFVAVVLVIVPLAAASKRRIDGWSESNSSDSKGFPDVVLCDNFVTMISGWSRSNALFEICVSLETGER